MNSDAFSRRLFLQQGMCFVSMATYARMLLDHAYVGPEPIEAIFPTKPTVEIFSDAGALDDQRVLRALVYSAIVD